jgi:hypothetical protein
MENNLLVKKVGQIESIENKCLKDIEVHYLSALRYLYVEIQAMMEEKIKTINSLGLPLDKITIYEDAKGMKVAVRNMEISGDIEVFALCN